MSKIIEEEKSFAENPRKVGKAHSPELKQIYEKPFPFLWVIKFNIINDLLIRNQYTVKENKEEERL